MLKLCLPIIKHEEDIYFIFTFFSVFTMCKPHLFKKMIQASYKATELAGESQILISGRREGRGGGNERAGTERDLRDVST